MATVGERKETKPMEFEHFTIDNNPSESETNISGIVDGDDFLGDPLGSTSNDNQMNAHTLTAGSSKEQDRFLLNNEAVAVSLKAEIDIEEAKIEHRDESDDSDHSWTPPASDELRPDSLCKTHYGVSANTCSKIKPLKDPVDKTVSRRRRLRCNNCDRLFCSEKSLANHQQKCQPEVVSHIKEESDMSMDIEGENDGFTSGQIHSQRLQHLRAVEREMSGANYASYDGIAIPTIAKLKRRTLSNEEREQIIKAYESKCTINAISEMMGMKTSTVHGVIAKYRKTGVVEAARRGGSTSCKITEAVKKEIKKWINEDCTISLKRLAQKVQSEFGIIVSHTSVAKQIGDFVFSLKRINPAEQPSNAEELADARKQYAIEFSALLTTLDWEKIIFVGKMEYTVCMRSSRTSSVSGKVPYLRYQNVHILCAMNREGIVHYATFRRLIDINVFTNFIKETKQILQLKNIVLPVLLVEDQIFTRAFEVRDSFEDCDRVMYLPPHSPFLHPMFSMFSEWKKIIARNNVHNEDSLIEAFDNASRLITKQDCEGYFAKMMEYITRCREESVMG